MEVLLFTIDGHRYGVLKDQVGSVETVGAVHRLPFLRSSLTVLAVMGDRTSTLADLAPCLGHAPAKGNSGATALVMSDQGQLRGFLVGAELFVQQIEPQSPIALPDFLQIPFVESFLWMAGDLVPIVSVRALFDQILKAGKTPESHSPALGNIQASAPGQTAALKVVNAGGKLLALQADELQEMPGKLRISRFPLLPPDVDGVAFFDDSILPVIDMARRVSRHELGGNPLMIGARVGNAALGLLVDDSHGEWSQPAAPVMDLPFICRTRWSQGAAIRGDQAAATVDLAVLLSAAETPGDEDAFSLRYQPASSVPTTFGKEDVEVAEVRVVGRRLAIPKSEIVNVVPSVPIHPVPHAPGMVAGVAIFEGELLPVMDLARVLGAESQPTSQWRMIQLCNGSFKALVLSEKEPETRLVKPGIQREVPVHLPYPVVYGCYTEGDAIRLVLNIHALALHFDESRVAELLPSLTPVEETREVEVRGEPVAQEQETEVYVEALAEEETQAASLAAETAGAPAPEALPETLAMPAGLAAFAAETTAEVEIPEFVTEDEIEMVGPATMESATVPAGAAKAKAASAAEGPAATEAPEAAVEEIPSLSPEPELEPASAPSAASDFAAGPASPSSPVPLPSESQESEAELEEERFVEEVHVRKQVVVEQPAHRGRRMVVAFVASVLLIFAAVYGLYILGLSRGHGVGQAVGQQATAQQQAASQQPAAVAQQPAAPAPAAQPPRPPGNPTYVVKQGDTLWDIAQRFTGNPLNYHNLAGQNLIKNPDLIFPGQVIQVDATQGK